MSNHLRTIITADAPHVRDQSLEAFCRDATLDGLLAECADLESFRRECDNLYQRVRALFFLYAIHRFYLPQKPGLPRTGRVPAEGHKRLLLRRFEEAVHLFLGAAKVSGPSDTLSSALAAAYHALAFQTLA